MLTQTRSTWRSGALGVHIYSEAAERMVVCHKAVVKYVYKLCVNEECLAFGQLRLIVGFKQLNGGSV